MREKLEQTKEFIEELYELAFHDTDAWVLTAMNTILDNGKKFPLLFDLLFKGSPIEDKKNQLTFAKIWAGEIELVEKKGKYVVYKELDETHFCIYHQSKDGVFSHRIAILNEFESADDLAKHPIKDQIFDEDVAFLLRDSKIFEIAEVVG